MKRIKAKEQGANMIPIKSVMTTVVHSIQPEAPIYEALELLVKQEISGLPVVNSENDLIGILSEKDVLEILLDSKDKKKVEDFMSTDVQSFPEDGDAVEICKFFIRTNFRRVPIVNGKKLVGIVSRRDIVSVIYEADSKFSDNLRYS